MLVNCLFFITSFLGDILAYIFYQKYLDTQPRNINYLFCAIVSAFLVWFFIFKLQDRGQVLRILIPLWAAGTAVFGYFIAGIITKTPFEKLFSLQALLSITAIGAGIFFLSRLSA